MFLPIYEVRRAYLMGRRSNEVRIITLKRQLECASAPKKTTAFKMPAVGMYLKWTQFWMTSSGGGVASPCKVWGKNEEQLERNKKANTKKLIIYFEHTFSCMNKFFINKRAPYTSKKKERKKKT